MSHDMEYSCFQTIHQMFAQEEPHHEFQALQEEARWDGGNHIIEAQQQWSGHWVE